MKDKTMRHKDQTPMQWSIADQKVSFQRIVPEAPYDAVVTRYFNVYFCYATLFLRYSSLSRSDDDF